MDSPDVGEGAYQQQLHDELHSHASAASGNSAPMHGHGHVGAGGEVEWDPEALGQALLTEESEWRAISNLDSFFCKVYTYYVQKGFWCMIATSITHIITLAFTICFSTFLLLFVNWRSLLFCSGSCDDVVGLRSGVFSHPTTGDVVVFVYFALFSLYWIWSCFSFIYVLRDAIEMRAFYRDDLDIADDDLVSLEWHYVLDALVTLQKSGRKKLCIVRELSALDITNRIMRRENYLIALINLDIFQLGPRDTKGVWNATPQCPWGWGDSESSARQKQQQMKEQRKQLRERKAAGHTVSVSSARGKPLLSDSSSSETQPVFDVGSSNTAVYHSLSSPTAPARARGSSGAGVGVPPSTAAGTVARPPRAHTGSLASWWSWAMLGTTLEWNLRFCVLHSLFDAHFNVNPLYLGAHGINALKSRFIVMGVANLLLSPFILIFMLIFFFLRHAEELHSKRTLFGPREWSQLAQWKIREFNELPHFFERRLTLAGVAAQQYMAQFPNTLLAIVAQAVAYMAGAVVAILLVLTVTDSQAITHRLWGHTLLWYLAVFSAVLALSRAMIPDKTIYPAPSLVMAEVTKHTHYFPAHWRHRTHTQDVHAEFSHMYPSRLSIFCFEILSVVMTPFVLIFCLPHSAERIVQFVQTRTVNVQGVGHLCSYAMFDLEQHGDPRYSHLQPVDFSTPAPATGGQQQASADSSKLPSGSPNAVRSSSLPSGTPLSTAPFPLRPQQGKLEKSFLNFSMQNPHWRAAEQEGVSANAGGQRFLQTIADSIYGRGGMGDDASPPLSRESSEAHAQPALTQRKFRAAASTLGGGATPRSDASLPHLPHSPISTRQDSLDSSTTDGTDAGDVGDGGERGGGGGGGRGDGKFESDDEEKSHGAGGTHHGHQSMRGSVAASSASYVLSQSDRHLIQSFADLVGMDGMGMGMGASSLHPSTLMRQSSWGNNAGGASTLGMSMFGGGGGGGLTQRGRQRGGVHQSGLFRSQLANSTSNSVLLGSTLLPRGGVGGLQGGLSASALLHLDPQSMREQLMLAQADQQADLFALLQSRVDDLDSDDIIRGNVPEGNEEEEEDEAEEETHARVSHEPPAFYTHSQRDVEMHQQQQHRPQPAYGHSAHASVNAAYASASPPQSLAHLPSITDSARSSFAPTPLQRQISDDNEAPPMSFFEPHAR